MGENNVDPYLLVFVEEPAAEKDRFVNEMIEYFTCERCGGKMKVFSETEQEFKGMRLFREMFRCSDCGFTATLWLAFKKELAIFGS